MHTFFVRENTIKIHQTLHGYADGHRLIEASRRLPRNEERMMLVLSDLSGPSVQPGFEEYLTGYPLVAARVFALARTWYAPEMDRPGCVWTHTLLVEQDDLARIQDLGVLLKLFVRPRKGESSASYRSALILTRDAQEDGDDKVPTYLQPTIDRLLLALYSQPNKQVFIVADRADQFDRLIIRVWNEQWLGLRSNFLFCTGSLSTRKSIGRPIDVQVVPRALAEQMRRGVQLGEFIDPAKATDSAEVPSWVSTMSHELFARDEGPLKAFVRHFSTELPDGRDSVAWLAELFGELEAVNEGTRPLTKLVDRLSKHFPEPREGTALKVAIMGGWIVGDENLLPKVPESKLARELTVTNHYAAFDGRMLRVHDRAKLFWRAQRKEALKLSLELIEIAPNPIQEEFLNGIVEALVPEDLLAILEENRKVALFFLAQKPTLATSAALWRLDDTEQREVFASIAASEHMGDAVWGQIAIAMLEAGSDMLAEKVVSAGGNEVISRVLEWFNSAPAAAPERLPFGWQRELRSQQPRLLEWLAHNHRRASSVALFVSLLNPHSAAVKNYGAEVWHRVTSIDFSGTPQRSYVSVAAFVLAVGFDNCSPAPYGLVAWAFQPVHNAVAGNELDDQSWAWIEDQVPSLSWWRNWDKCERLRRALVEHFVRHSWPVEYFLKAVVDDDAFGKVIDYCRFDWGARDFLRKVANRSADDRVSATRFQQNMLARYR